LFFGFSGSQIPSFFVLHEIPKQNLEKDYMSFAEISLKKRASLKKFLF